MTICFSCASDKGYIRDGGRVSLCTNCRKRHGLPTTHPTERGLPYLRLLHESDDDSPILEDSRSGDRRTLEDAWGDA